MLQAMPSLVSRSDSAQIACSSFGNSPRSSACTSLASAFHAAALAPNTDNPQLIAIVCTCVVSSNSPMVLPDIVPVIAHSMLPLRTLGMMSAKLVCTGVPPSASTRSDCAGLEVRMRRPARSPRPLIGLLQKITCAGYT